MKVSKSLFYNEYDEFVVSCIVERYSLRIDVIVCPFFFNLLDVNENLSEAGSAGSLSRPGDKSSVHSKYVQVFLILFGDLVLLFN